MLDFAIIPDVIGGTEAENDALLDEWPFGTFWGTPVWHMHEEVSRLKRLCTDYPRVALGSSGKWGTPGTLPWWQRMAEAMDAVCDDQGRPPCKLHGLRMLNPEVFTRLPLASADSVNVARNIKYDVAWKGTYQPPDKDWKALVLAARIESHQSASHWQGSTQLALPLYG